MRLIDIEPYENKADVSSCKVVMWCNGDGYITSESVLTKNIPTLDYKDLVPRGEWIDCRGGDATCSRCGIRQKAVYDDDNEQHFCGHCGARMVSK